MRIVLVTETFAPAADADAETARHLCDAFLAAGHDVLVLTATTGKDSYRSASVGRLRRTPNPPALRERIIGFAPDVMQVLRPRSLGGIAMRVLDGTGLSVFALDPTPLSPRVGTAVASTWAGARRLGMFGVQARVWSPGVRADEHHPGLRSDELHDAWARGSSRTVVGYAGPVGVATSKHVRRLVRIAEADALRLVVLGRGSGTATLKEAGARIGGACGGLELARGIASLDVFVQARKHHAGLGAVRKALASGVPVVGLETGPLAEVVTTGHNGVLVAPGQGRGGLRDALLRLAADPAQRATLAANARASVAERSWAVAAAELVEIYAPMRTTV